MGLEVDYTIVKDYCEKYDFNCIEEFKNIKILLDWCSNKG